MNNHGSGFVFGPSTTHCNRLIMPYSVGPNGFLLYTFDESSIWYPNSGSINHAC